ncbi:MAG: glycosyltransferase family 9 protein, partial [Candidatus Marinimicrobia bacterium]|nr:glycosyltransferase family 9 protein [Candidatus Neomarinimicrobiota bacterium]
VLTMSPLKTLKNIFPSARIDFLTLNDFAPILEGNKYIDRIILFDRNGGFRQLIKTGRWINNSTYDLVIDFHNSLRSKIIRFWVRKIPKRILIKPQWKRFLLFRFRKNLFPIDFSQLQLLHQPIKEWMINEKYPLPELFVSEIETKQAGIFLKEKGVKKPYIIIIPGAAWPQKRWLVDNYCQLLGELNNRENVDFVILGGKTDDICNKIAKCDSTFINLHGQTNLRESMAIIAKSKYVIGADTGLVHAAEALGKRVVMILGPTSRETGAGVNQNDSISIENRDVWCRPCSQTGKRKCYRDEQYCLTTITPEFVLSKIIEGGLL